MSSNTFIKDRLIRRQIRLTRLAKGISNKAKKKLVPLSQEIFDFIDKESELDAIKAKRVQQKIDKVLAKLQLKHELLEDVDEFLKNEVEYFEKLLASSVETSTLFELAPETVATITNNAPMTFIPPKAGAAEIVITPVELIKKLENDIGKNAMTVVRAGILDGDSNKVIARNVRKKIGDLGVKQTELVVRTVTNHLAAAARNEVTREYKDFFQGEKYTATLDNRTTLFCGKTDGEIFPLDSGPFPPMHIGCRSLRVPIVKQQYQIPGLEGKRPAKEKDEDGNITPTRVSADTKYAAWLREQPQHFQEEVLGKKRAELFRTGKMKLENFVDDSGATISLKDLKDKNGNPIIE